MNTISAARRKIGWWLGTIRHVNKILKQDPADRQYLTLAYDDRVPVAADHALELSPNNAKLIELQERYAALDLPAVKHMQWGQRATSFIADNLKYFRGDTPYVWHYRRSRKVTELTYFIFMQYIAQKDDRGLFRLLKEDGSFGCWHFEYPERPVVSRDLLDSINEILYLDRQLSIFEWEGLRVLDVGAGYGRLAHRMLTALPNVVDYCCVDAIPESTFLCDFYLKHRGLSGRARSLPLDKVESTLAPGQFDLALNIHSFSECTLDAVTWWVEEISRLKIPYLLIVPNEPDELLTNEGQGLRRNFLPVLESAGYKLKHREPVLNEPAVRKLVDVQDQFYLFVRASD
jgi:hypothetical protein